MEGQNRIDRKFSRMLGRKKTKAPAIQKPFGEAATPSTLSFTSRSFDEHPHTYAYGAPEPVPAPPYHAPPSPPQPNNFNRIISINEAERRRQQQAELDSQRRLNSTETRIRELRHMIREKRQLDIQIFRRRDVQLEDRTIVIEDCDKSDALQDKIVAIIEGWEEDQFVGHEKELVIRIKSGMSAAIDQYTPWKVQRPWDPCYEETDEMSKNGWGDESDSDSDSE